MSVCPLSNGLPSHVANAMGGSVPRGALMMASSNAGPQATTPIRIAASGWRFGRHWYFNASREFWVIAGPGYLSFRVAGAGSFLRIRRLRAGVPKTHRPIPLSSPTPHPSLSGTEPPSTLQTTSRGERQSLLQSAANERIVPRSFPRGASLQECQHPARA